MKTTKPWWRTMLTLLLAGTAGTGWAVTPDLGGFCWRDGSNSTRQLWTFDTTNAFGDLIAPSFKTNQPGNPFAIMTQGATGVGWRSTTCASGLGGCGAVVTAVLPLTSNDAFTNNVGDPVIVYLSQQFGYNANADGLVTNYDDPPTLGSAQGFWDMGKSGNKTVLTLTNSGAPAGTLRYFFIQGTYNLSGVSGLPGKFAVTNSAGVGNATVLQTNSTLVEQPLDPSGDLSLNSWYNQAILLRTPADTAGGNDTVTISRVGAVFWVDAVLVETLDRVAVNDALNAAANTATNIPFTQLLGNDRGGGLITVGAATNCTVSTNAGNVVTCTPTPAFTGTASFWYTNRDCAGLTNLGAQVTVTVLNNPPVANPDNYTRPKGVALKIKISDLATNDTDADANLLTVTGINLTTTNGVHLATNGSLLTYTNSATLDANDRFTYTVSDGQGGTATGTVILTVVGGQPGTPATITVAPSNHVDLVFHGIPGTGYQVQRSTNAGSTWTTLASPVANGTGTNPVGQINYTDSFGDLLPTPGIPTSAVYRLFLP